MDEQGRLFSFRMGERSPDTLVITEANQRAAELLTSWRAWPGGALALTGPPGSGKTHLALAWALEAGARQVGPVAPDVAAQAFQEAEGRLLVDDADNGAVPEATLWRLLDLARAQDGALLLVGAQAPAAWPAATPDLRSRLAALGVARLEEPDESLMEVVLRRFCREQFIHLSDDAACYVAQRLPRTFAAARAWVEALETGLVRGARPVGLKAARLAYEKVRVGLSDGGDGAGDEQDA
jgi:chromosomal replication initiation ATPase DnaA